MTETQGHCATCKWFDPLNESSSNTGICRVMPPTVIPTQMRLDPPGMGGTSFGAMTKVKEERSTKPFTTWPIVRREDWCGEYSTRRKQQ